VISLQQPSAPVEASAPSVPFEPFTATDAEIAEYEAWLDAVEKTLPPFEPEPESGPVCGRCGSTRGDLDIRGGLCGPCWQDDIDAAAEHELSGADLPF
jgi:hypothetical protein